MGSHTHIIGSVCVCVCLRDMHPQAVSSFLHGFEHFAGRESKKLISSL